MTRRYPMALLAAMLVAGKAGRFPLARTPILEPIPPRERDRFDLAALAKAEAKRERRRQRNLRETSL